jgi:hypothetical protein
LDNPITFEEGAVDWKGDDLNDSGFERAIHYLRDGEPKKYALELHAKLENTPYAITTYQVNRSFYRVWAIYQREVGRPAKSRDCIFTTTFFGTPAKTKKSSAWKALDAVSEWLRKENIK